MPYFYDVKGILETKAEMQIAIMAGEWRILRTRAKSGKGGILMTGTTVHSASLH
jgi:hypothetical protein